MNYSDFAIEQLKRRLTEKAFHNSTPKKYAGDMLEAFEVIEQLQKKMRERKNREPLTLDELRGMNGQPVWISECTNWGHWELSADAEDYLTHRELGLYGITWAAYREKDETECGENAEKI